MRVIFSYVLCFVFFYFFYFVHSMKLTKWPSGLSVFLRIVDFIRFRFKLSAVRPSYIDDQSLYRSCFRLSCLGSSSASPTSARTLRHSSSSDMSLATADTAADTRPHQFFDVAACNYRLIGRHDHRRCG